MDIQKITTIVNSNEISNDIKSKFILEIIATDKNIIPSILNILEIERTKNNELILDQNAELSRALIVLKDENLKYNKKIISDPKWVVGEIIKHYKKWKDIIRCNFKIDELD
jgi:hypothetical protein